MAQGVDPLSAGISAGAGLLTGLFDAAAKAKAQKRELAAQQEAQATQTELGSQQQLASGQTGAFQSLMNAWQKGLLR